MVSMSRRWKVVPVPAPVFGFPMTCPIEEEGTPYKASSTDPKRNGIPTWPGLCCTVDDDPGLCSPTLCIAAPPLPLSVLLSVVA